MIRRKVRLIHENNTTRVYDKETDKEIPGVLSFDFNQDSEQTNAQMMVLVTDVDMEVWAEIAGVTREDLLAED